MFSQLLSLFFSLFQSLETGFGKYIYVYREIRRFYEIDTRCFDFVTKLRTEVYTRIRFLLFEIKTQAFCLFNFNFYKLLHYVNTLTLKTEVEFIC